MGDAAVAVLAAAQQGNARHEQLVACGLTRSAIRHRIRAGRLFEVYPRVFSVGRRPITPLERASAAVLACGPTAALSHGSAMTLWGYFRQWDSPFEVTVTRDRRPNGVTVHRSSTLARRDLTTHLGIRVTTPARTLFDVAPRLARATLTRKVNDALVSPFMSDTSLLELLNRHPTARATRLIAPLLPGDGSGPTRSELENGFKAFCERYGLPRPVTNVIVAGYLVDAYFPDHGLIVELDGFDFHRSRTAFERDRDRDADTLFAGHPTVRITDERIQQAPGKEAKRLTRILDQCLAAPRSTPAAGQRPR